MIRNSFGIHTDVNGMYLPLLRQSALVKVLFEPSEAGVVKSWKSQANPNTYWLARTNKDQDASNPLGELQTRYYAATTEVEVRAVGVWYADWIASWALPAGLGYFFWEGGPNEADDMTQRAVWYSDAFTRRCLEIGLKPAAGMYSFGKPGVMKYDGYDGWLPWQPLFRFIEQANAGKTEPVAGFQFHEYALGHSMVGSVDYAIERYKLTGYKGPVFVGEWGYAFGDKPSSTEEVLSQFTTMNTRYGSDDRFCGAALYDIRKNAGAFSWEYMYGDTERALIAQALPTLPISNFSGGTTPPPPPPPVPSDKWVQVTGWSNQRAEPSSTATLLGSIQVANPRTKLLVRKPGTSGYVQAVGQGFWILEQNTVEV